MIARHVTALANPWVQTATGRAVDLLEPTAAMIDLEVDVPEHLARIARFCGALRSGPYSVAQHCVMGADALYRDTRRRDMAAAFLLHDAHEYVVGDIPTPVALALDVLTSDHTVGGESGFARALAQLKAQLDRAIHAAAGVAFPLDSDVAAAVKVMDLRMLMTESRHLMAQPAPSWGPRYEEVEPLRIVGRFRVWPWPEAADEYRERLKRYLPQGLTHTKPKPRPLQDIAVRRRATV